jgi:DNA polymerase-3 subunit beta
LKIQLPASALLDAITCVLQGVAKQTTKPILTNIKIVVDGGLLTISATDLEMAVRHSIPMEGSFSAVVEPRRLAAILKELGDDSVSLAIDDDTVVVKASAGKWNLPSMNPDEFPDVSDLASADLIELTVMAGAFRRLVKRTAFAAEKRENTWYAVMGILFEVEQSRFRMVATDTKRLAVDEVPCSTGDMAAMKGGYLVPVKAVQLVERNIRSDDEMVTVRLTANAAEFKLANATIYTRLVEGRFPPWAQFIPRKLPVTMQLPLAEFASKVRQASITAEADNKRVDFAFGPGLVEMKAHGAESGSSEVDMSLTDYDGKAVEIAFDPVYLSSYFASVNDENLVTLKITAEADRAVFSCGDSFYLVVPMTK